ncbi:MAG: hypothetical protein ACTSQK_08030 [Candidatus Heimdallarchaeota archaeon]
MIIEILAYISVGILTLGWVISMTMDFFKKIYEKQENSSAAMEDAN